MPRPALLLQAVILAVLVLLPAAGGPAGASPALDQTCVIETTTVTAVGQIKETVCAAALHPAANVRVKLVDFLTSRNAIRDCTPLEAGCTNRTFFLGGTYEQPFWNQTIGEVPVARGDWALVEWVDAEMPYGQTEKNWPAVYRRASDANLRVTLTSSLTDVAELAAVKLVGVADADGTPMRWESDPFTLTNGDNTLVMVLPTVTLPDHITSFTLPDYPLEITWTLENVPGGVALSGLSPTKHNLFVTLANPLDDTKLFLSVLDYTTAWARPADTAAEAIGPGFFLGDPPGIYSAFQQFDGGGVPRFHKTDFNPATGAITIGAELHYWDEIAPVGQTLDALGGIFSVCPAYWTTQALLTTLHARCGGWAVFMMDSLNVHGITGDLVGVVAEIAPDCPRRVCRFLVKNWGGFAAGGAGGASGHAAFPYLYTQVTDQAGAGGQGTANPPPWFTDHALVRVSGKIFDPSYGTGPFDDLATWDDDSLDGFCENRAGHQHCVHNDEAAFGTVGRQICISSLNRAPPGVGEAERCP